MTWAPLLLADPSPSLRLLVLRDLLNRPEDDEEVRELKKLQEEDPLILKFLALQNEDGSWREVADRDISTLAVLNALARVESHLPEDLKP